MRPGSAPGRHHEVVLEVPLVAVVDDVDAVEYAAVGAGLGRLRATRLFAQGEPSLPSEHHRAEWYSGGSRRLAVPFGGLRVSSVDRFGHDRGLHAPCRALHDDWSR